MNKNNAASIIATTLYIACIVVSAKSLIKTHRREKAKRSQIRTDGNLDLVALSRARDAVIARINRGDYLGKPMDDVAAAFADQIEFEKMTIRFDQ